jgi:hypothetical protein
MAAASFDEQFHAAIGQQLGGWGGVGCWVVWFFSVSLNFA